jgi:NADPH2:quinone reductase
VKALAYQQAHTLDAFAVELVEVEEPRTRDGDVLVEVRATGVVVETGSAVGGLEVGDRVIGTGDPTRDGCWAQRVAVDHRVVAKIPDRLAFVDAASLPIGILTGWEAVFRDQSALPPGVDTVLIIGGAGGVGSLTTQLLKAKTSAFVISTASRPESRDWCRTMGADLVVDHTADLGDQLRRAGVAHVDMVLSTAATANSLLQIAAVLRPFGHVSTIDVGTPLDLAPLVAKSASLHTEMVFSQVVSGTDPSSQGRILGNVVEYVGSDQLRPIVTMTLTGLTADTMKTAHTMLESRRTIGKVVIDV